MSDSDREEKIVKISKQLGETTPEQIAATDLRAVIALIPFVGGALNTLATELIPNWKMDRLYGFVGALKVDLDRMARIDVVDEAVINADSLRVFKAVIDEANGRTRWWMPYWEAKPRDEKGFGQKGSAIDITTHRGTPKSGERGAKFSARISEVIEGKLLKVDFFDGDFLGSGEWNFEQIDGKTKVRYRWNVVPHRLMYSVLAPFVKARMGKMHSDIMQEGFKGLNRYLATSQS